MKSKFAKRLICMTLAFQLAMGGSNWNVSAQENARMMQTVTNEPIDLMSEPIVDWANGYGQILTDGTNVGGKKITLWDGEQTVEYGRGVCMHAFESAEMAKVIYDISKYDHNVFKATVGVDYNSGTYQTQRGDCVFKVLADDKEIYSSEILYSSSKETEIIALIPEGTQRLTLAVTNADSNNNCDWADWVDPRLEQVADAGMLIKDFTAKIGKKTLEKSEETKITVTGHRLNGDIIENILESCSFESSDDSVATVDKMGNVTAIHYGNTKITVTVTEGDIVKKEKINVTVLPERENGVNVKSPSENMEFVLLPGQDGSLQYMVFSDEEMVVQPSALGLVTSLGEFTHGLKLEKQETKEINETYDMISGKKSEYVNHCNETVFTFSKEGTDAEFQVIARAYDDGIAYRYAIESEGEFSISSELSAFRAPEGSKTTAMRYNSAGEGLSHEDPYEKGTIADINGQIYNMPFLYQTERDEMVLVTEAALSAEYTGSVLKGQNDNELKFSFTPKQNKDVQATAPWVSPWRTAIIGGEKEIVENTMTENLSPACKIEDTSWIKPATTAWTWYVSPGFGPQSDPELIKKYIDVAAEFGWKYYLMDEGWQGKRVPGDQIDGDFHRWQGIPEWLDEIVAYGKEKGIGIMAWVHNKDIDTPKEEIFVKELHDHGIVGLKVDFFNDESQAGMKRYQDVYELCAENKMMVDIHGSNKATGEVRTWPNLLTREGIRGQEFNDVNAARDIMYVYTRAAIGPADFNPAIDLLKGGNATAGHKVALNILYETGLPCPSDKGETYKRLNLFSLLKDFPASWDETLFLDGDPETYATLARRHGEDWYVASVCTTERSQELKLDFLGNGEYTAYIYKDGASRWDIDFEIRKVTAQDVLAVQMKENGGYAVKIVKGEPVFPTKVVLNEKELKLDSGESAELKAVVFPENVKDYSKVEWVSSNPDIVSIDANGKFTAHNCGIAYVTAKVTVPFENGISIVSEPCKVWVYPTGGYEKGKDWTIVNEDSRYWRVDKEDQLTIMLQSGRILREKNGGINEFFVDADRDFEASVKLNFTPSENYQSAGLLILGDNTAYTGLWRRAHSWLGGNLINMVTYANDGNDISEKGKKLENSAENPVWLKLVKEGVQITSYTSVDGEKWELLYTENNENLNNAGKIRVGIYAGDNTVGKNIPAVFEKFTYKAKGGESKVIPFATKIQTEIMDFEMKKVGKTDYEVGENFDASDYVFTAYYSDKTDIEIIGNNCEVTGFDATIVGTQNVTFTYEENSVTVPVHVSEPGKYNITVDGKLVQSAVYNTKITIKAPVASEGKIFTGWKLDGKVVSAAKEYSFYISGNMDFTACYDEVTVTPEALLSNVITTDRGDGKYDIKFVTQLVVPEGYTIEEAGLVWSNKGESYNDEFKLDIAKYGTDGGVKLTKISKISNTWQYSVTIKGVPATVGCVPGRAYAKLVKADEEVKTVQSEVKAGYIK